VILAVDTGTKESAIVAIESDTDLCAGFPHGIYPNHKVERILETILSDCVVFEHFKASGQPMGNSSVETIWWEGRFTKCGYATKYLMERREVLKILGIRFGKSADSNVYQWCLNSYGPKGNPKNPGPTFGFKSHMWQSLGLAAAFYRSGDLTVPL